MQRAGFADDGGDLGGSLGQHANFILPKYAGVDGLHDQHALQDPAIDEGNPEEGLKAFFAGFAKKLEARMVLDLLHGDRADLLGYQAGEAFVERQAEDADTLGAQSECGGQHEVGSIRLEQISRADIGLKTPGNQSDDVHEGFGRLAALGRQGADLLQSQNVVIVAVLRTWAHVYKVPHRFYAIIFRP